MGARNAAEEMENLRLSDSDVEDLRNSPSKQRARKPSNQRLPPEENGSTPGPTGSHDETLFDREEAREAALRDELQSVRNINGVIEGLLDSLDRAKGNMQVRSLSHLFLISSFAFG